MTHAPLFPRLILILALIASLCGGTAHAQDSHAQVHQDSYAQVQQLLKTGKVTQALKQADDYIAAHPNDPQMRFIRAGVLQAAGHADEAENALTQLTRDYPELAEPWNNLAVFYAAHGQLDDARSALQAALRINPTYATALENLGDIDIRLALRSYKQARSADPGASARLSRKIDTAQRVVDGNSSASTKSTAPQPLPPQPAASRPEASQPAAPHPHPVASQPEMPQPAASSQSAASSQPEVPQPMVPQSAASQPVASPQSIASQPETAASGKTAPAASSSSQAQPKTERSAP